jgi:Ca-activated chloride channel family protein
MKNASGKTNLRALWLLICLGALPLMDQGNKLHAQQVTAGDEPTTRILFIFDASNSMAGQWDGARKIDMAREVLFEMVDSLARLDHLEMALRVYGHQSPVPPQDCSDTKLEVPFGPSNASMIRQKLRYINPKGTTPIAHSLELAPGDFPPCDYCRNVILLITDGIEACDGDPCLVSQNLQKQGIILRPFVIGIGNDPGFKETFNCIGEYYDAPTKEQFREVLEVVITQALNATSAQINLLNSRSEPTETNVNVVLYDRISGVIRYNMIHTINMQGNPDTLNLDQLNIYDVVVQTIPPVSFDNVRLVPGRHNTISIDAPQGYLYVRTRRGNSYEKEKILVKKAGQTKTINIQEIGHVGKYVVGRYDLEIPIYPLMEVKDVEIHQSNTTTVEIPTPGLITFLSKKPGAGSLYRLNEYADQIWVLNLQENQKTQRFYLQPGSYRVIFRRGDLKSTASSIVRDFVVLQGSPETIKLYRNDR